MILMEMWLMHSRLSRGTCVGILALSLSAVPAFAHHGWGGNSEQEFELTGTVTTGVSLSGPHATMKVLSDGKVWDITLAPPARTSQAGLKEGVIPVGATVMIHGHRNLDPKRLEIKTERVTWNGRLFNVYPERK
jgi:hypothetical protein